MLEMSHIYDITLCRFSASLPDVGSKKSWGSNMHIARRFTTAGRDPYETVAFRSTSSEIRNPDGSVVFAAEDIEVPAEWSQVACDILAQKYLRKAGVPARLAVIEEEGVPDWLWRRIPDAAALAALPKKARSAAEASAKPCVDPPPPPATPFRRT